eukprot:CAMPEP_0117432320 /NCGR_PEP_ID=MMETSP0758-20121206/11820_1 /TAXON_ID=63605 /ORGANISM="Percolomonas cosmopolitus, Strain AE-1 (ATCC 50343)" /LENGTH=359 /DNA_ID=CAMNT_0005222143 /DNA_START=53 /DNA_END=1130 /DNA_ORIENTATION=-
MPSLTRKRTIGDDDESDYDNFVVEEQSEDEEEEEYVAPKKKKTKRKKSKKKNAMEDDSDKKKKDKRKRSSKKETPEEEEDINNLQSSRKRRRLNRKKNSDDSYEDGLQFDEEQEKGTKKKVGRRRKVRENPEDDIHLEDQKNQRGPSKADLKAAQDARADEIAKELLDKMDEAKIEDDAVPQGSARLAKLRLCKEVSTQCRKQLVCRSLLQDGLLRRFTAWLTRQGELRELPILSIRSTILNILLEIPVREVELDENENCITRLMLEESKLQDCISYLSRHPLESLENRTKAKRIVESWSRMLKQNKNVVDPNKNRKRQLDTRPPAGALRRTVGFDFIHKPNSKINTEENENEKQAVSS